MEEPNVNRLNGIPNFGHGFPEYVPEQDVVADAGAPEGEEVETQTEETPSEPVDITSINSI